MSAAAMSHDAKQLVSKGRTWNSTKYNTIEIEARQRILPVC